MNQKQTMKKTFNIINNKKLYWPGITLRSLFQLLNNLLIGYWFYVVIDSALAGDIQGVLRGTIVGFIFMIVLAIFLGVSSRMYESAIATTTGKIRKLVINKILKLPMKYKDDNHSGDLISRATNDIKEMERVFGPTFLMFLSNSFGAVGAIIFMMFINWRIALGVLTLATFTTLLNIPFVNPLKKISDQFQKQTAKLTEFFSDIVVSSQITRMYGLEKNVEEKFEELNEKLKTTSLKRVIKNSKLNGINYLSMLINFMGILGVGFYFVLNDLGTVGEVIFIVQLSNGVTNLVMNAGNLMTRMQTALAGSERIFELLELEDEPEKYSLKSKINNLKDNIEIGMYNISFGYEKDKKVLENFSLEIPKGKVYALVGSSGCGKTTIMKLLMGLYEPENGDIVISNKKLSESTLKEFRDNIAYVPQMAYLYTGDILTNIKYGNMSKNVEDVIEAAKLANADDFIKQFPDGYYSKVGEKGTHISGGQRQRIAIARAILKDSPVLLLDEATSALDNESEILVQNALDNLMKNKTTLVVAHRLSTIQNADKILVMDKGKIVQEGKHEELINKKGLYKKLYDMQFENI